VLAHCALLQWYSTPHQMVCHVSLLLLMLRDYCCRVFTVTFSMMEIYCEMLNDLLDPSKLNLDVQVRLSPTIINLVI
jgi:hypothetical protein